MGRRGPKSSAEIATLPTARQGPLHITTSPRYETEPPAHLSEATQAWWKQILTNHRLEHHQLRILQAACEAWDVYRVASDDLKKHGLVYADPRGMIRARPETSIARDARTSFLRALREMHLDDDPPVTKPRPFFER
jgi:P27 family predicted phage terminase small subunit